MPLSLLAGPGVRRRLAGYRGEVSNYYLEGNKDNKFLSPEDDDGNASIFSDKSSDLDGQSTSQQEDGSETPRPFPNFAERVRLWTPTAESFGWP